MINVTVANLKKSIQVIKSLCNKYLKENIRKYIIIDKNKYNNKKIYITLFKMNEIKKKITIEIIPNS